MQTGLSKPNEPLKLRMRIVASRRLWHYPFSFLYGNMEAAGYSKMSADIYQTVRCHITQDRLTADRNTLTSPPSTVWASSVHICTTRNIQKRWNLWEFKNTWIFVSNYSPTFYGSSDSAWRNTAFWKWADLICRRVRSPGMWRRFIWYGRFGVVCWRHRQASHPSHENLVSRTDMESSPIL